MKIPARFRGHPPLLALAFTRLVAGPALLYVALFCALTYPLIGSFSTHYFTNAGDGLQNVWNLWWMNRALTVLHTSPWYTTYLHYPAGVSLVGHTLNPFNGFVAIALTRFMTLVQAHNTIVLFSFVMGGVGAFWLCLKLCGQYLAALVGGFVFTFSQYHFAHADGHLQLISLEWVPVFVLAWMALLECPSLKLGMMSAMTLLLVLLCDYYYFAYCLALAALIFGWEVVRRRSLARLIISPMILFLVMAAVTCGPLLWSLLALNARDPLLGAHAPDEFSVDLLGVIIPGGHWRFASLTQGFWDVLPGNIQESSVDLGIAVMALLGFLLVRRSGPALWWLILMVFWSLSLGPVVRVWGVPLERIPTPYRELEKVAPLLALSGVPARMMVMVTLATAVLVSVALRLLFYQSQRARAVASALLVVLALEYLPRALPTTAPPVPMYVSALAAASDGGVLDLVSGYSAERPFGTDTGAGIALYFQTVHQHPIASGYIARLPTSTWQQLQRITALVDSAAYDALCHDFQLRYLVVAHAGAASLPASADLLVDDVAADAVVYDLARNGACVSDPPRAPSRRRRSACRAADWQWTCARSDRESPSCPRQ